MLPDFPDLKKDLFDRLFEFLEARVAFHLGPLSRIRRVSVFEGRGDRRFTRSSGETETFTMQQVHGEFSIPTKELPTTTLDTILAKIDNAAQQIARQMAENIYQTISEAVERVGNTIDAKGQKPSAELILETLAKIQVDFDRDGKPRMPELHIHPTLEEATKLAFEELENNPELKNNSSKLWKKNVRSGVLERLVESWLDSAGERTYQSPFCQILCAQGHHVIHSSRHSPVEQGKDIITIGPDGRPWAFQLKGNPGGRLTLQQYRVIEAQLLELVNLPISHPSVPAVQHRAFLVTNGLVEEEVTLAIDKLNQGFKRDGFPNRQLEIIQRGDLVRWCQELGSSLWPSELEDVNLLLEMLVDQGVGLLPKQKLHRLLTHLLGLQEEQSLKLNAERVRRRITSAALLIAVALKNFSAKENHFAVISAWTMFSAYAIASCERYEVSFDKNACPAVALALSAIRDSLLALSDEVTNRPVPVEGNSIVDFVAYRARYTLLLSLFSILWFWCEEDEWPSPEKKAEIKSFLSSGIQQLYCWGEAAIPQILPYYWFLRENDGSASIEALLAQLLQLITSEDEKGQVKGISSPYFAFEDVARHALAPILGQQQDPLRKESPGLTSFYAEGLLHLLVRTGRKYTCKQLWPALTKVEWVFFAPASRWQYCLWRNKEGEYTEIQPPLTKHWNQLVEEARSVSCDIAPQPLVENRFLSALFLILFPYRANPQVIRKLGWQFDRTWFILPPLNDGVGKAQGRRSGNNRKSHAGLQRNRKLGVHRRSQQEGRPRRSHT